MYYELYVDSLFLVNFVMNLYLLLLTDRSLFRTATRKRLLLGAIVGAILYFLPFFCMGPIWLRCILGIPPGGIAMIVIAFRVRSIRNFFRIMEKIFMYSIMMGGAMLLLKKLPWFEQRMTGIWGILGVGALLYLLIGYLMDNRQQKNSLCRVTMIDKGNRITVTALVDSGNSLVEPISGKPVSIVEKGLVSSLWGEEPHLYRAIPYHSIGKKKGILKGYLLKEMQIEVNGVTKICKETYVAVCEEYITSEENGRESNDSKSHVKMILNPQLFKGEEKMRKERFDWYYDVESGSSG